MGALRKDKEVRVIRFLGRKTLLAYLRSPVGYRVRAQLLAEADEEPARVLLISEGNGVTVYTKGNVMVRHEERPVCLTPEGNDHADKCLRRRLRWWARGLRYRLTFWTDSRPLVQRESMWIKTLES